MTYQELISQAVALSGKGAEGQVVTGKTLKTALNKLNEILGDWENEDLGTWLEQEYQFCTTVGKDVYTVGTGKDIDIDHPLSFVEMSTKTIPGAVTWKGKTTVAVFLALTAATEGDYYQFTDSDGTILIGDFGVINKDVTVLITSSDYDLVKDSGIYITLDEYMYSDYDGLPDKYGQGTPLIFHYKPGTTYGELYLWKTGALGAHLRFTTYKGFTEITTSNVTDVLDFPKSWRRALEYALAYELAFFYSAPPDKITKLETKAYQHLEGAKGSNKTSGSIQFHASTDSY